MKKLLILWIILISTIMVNAQKKGFFRQQVGIYQGVMAGLFGDPAQYILGCNYNYRPSKGVCITSKIGGSFSAIGRSFQMTIGAKFNGRVTKRVQPSFYMDMGLDAPSSYYMGVGFIYGIGGGIEIHIGNRLYTGVLFSSQMILGGRNEIYLGGSVPFMFKF